MTRMQILIAGLALVAGPTTAEAQMSGGGAADGAKPEIAIRGGLASSTVAVGEELNSDDIERLAGFFIGADYAIPYRDGLWLKAGAAIVQKGAGIQSSEDDVHWTYVQVPAVAELRFGDHGPSALRPKAFLGPTLSFMTSCDDGGFECNDESTIELGLTLGGSVTFRQIELQLRYDLGLTQVFDDMDVKNRSILLTAGLIL